MKRRRRVLSIITINHESCISRALFITPAAFSIPPSIGVGVVAPCDIYRRVNFHSSEVTSQSAPVAQALPYPPRLYTCELESHMYPINIGCESIIDCVRIEIIFHESMTQSMHPIVTDYILLT